MPNDGKMKDYSQKIIDNVTNITNEQKKQVSNCHFDFTDDQHLNFL